MFENSAIGRETPREPNRFDIDALGGPEVFLFYGSQRQVVTCKRPCRFPCERLNELRSRLIYARELQERNSQGVVRVGVGTRGASKQINAALEIGLLSAARNDRHACTE